MRREHARGRKVIARLDYGRWKRRHSPPVDALTRRELLCAAAASAAAALLSSCASPSRGTADANGASAGARGRKVVVVGAGLAGLAAAYELKSAGYDVAVLESRGSVGGRVLTFRDFVADRHVEGGGELIGLNHPLWNAYATKFGLAFLPIEEDEEAEAPVVLHGERLTKAESDALYQEMDAQFATLNALAEKVDADAPWSSADAAALDARSTASWVESLECSERCKAAITAQLASDNGVATSGQSLLALLAEVKGGGLEKYWTDSERLRCKGGNQQLAERLRDAIGADRVRLGCHVRRVDAGERGVAVEYGSRSPSGKVTSSDLAADDVVLAIPPSTWRNVVFEPALPRSLAPAMGVNVKFLTELKRRVWAAKELSPEGLTDGPIAETWDATQGQPLDGHFCLTTFSGGPAAQQCRDWRPDERPARLVAELERLLPLVRSAVVRSRFMDWPSDPLTLGGYSFPAPGQVTTVAPQLRAGLGRLHFAGEHCSSAFVGYMEGALESGVAVARRIAQRDGVAS
jgi:monoamine oxidase